MKHKGLTFRVLLALVLVLLLTLAATAAAQDSEPSVNVVIIGGDTLQLGPCSGNGPEANNMGATWGGCLPVSGFAGLDAFTFTAMDHTAVSAASLAPFDTAVLNVASTRMACNTGNLTSQQKADLLDFVGDGKKLIIFDSECTPQDYTWLPFPFTTANPGAMGAPGSLTIVEENTLSSNVSTDPYYIDAYHLSTSTDAVGDMNVMTTFDPNWCVDMSGTNYLQVTGPVHTYAKYPAGTDVGLIVYNGLDQDFQGYGFDDPWLRKMWIQELNQPFNPSNLPCGFTVVGITLGPASAENEVGENHTVSATLSDLLGNPQSGIAVAFDVTTGPNAGTSGSCSANADCTTDTNGEVSFTYTGDGGEGTDSIEACFTDQAGNHICSQVATKNWIIVDVPVAIDIKPQSCPNPLGTKDRGVLPIAILGTGDFDVTMVDPASVQLEGIAPLRWALEDVAAPYEPFLGREDIHDCTEAGPDGFLDLAIKFDVQEVIVALGEVNDGDVLVLRLTGNLKEEYGSTPIVGEDVVWIVKKVKK